MIPQRVDDGDFSVAMQDGEWNFEYPFADRGDFVSFVATRTMRVDAVKFRPPAKMTPMQFLQLPLINGAIQIGYLTSFSPPKGAGNALLEYTEEYASVPQTRTEYNSVSYTQIVALSSGESSFSYGAVAYGEISAILDGKTVFEYQLSTPLPTLHQPRFVNVGGNHTFVFGSIHEILTQAGYILAQDSESEIYKCEIFTRKSIYAFRSRPRQIS